MGAGETRSLADAEKLLSGLSARANALQRARGLQGLPAGIREDLAAVRATMVAEQSMAVAMEADRTELASRLQALTAESAALREELDSLQQAKKNGWTTAESEQAAAKAAAAHQPVDDAGSAEGERGGAAPPPWGARKAVRTGRNKLRQRAKQRKLGNATMLTGRRDNDAHVGLRLLDGAGGRSAELLFAVVRSAGSEATTAGWALRALGESVPLREPPAMLLAQFLGAEHPAPTRCMAADAIGLLAEEALSATQALANACLGDEDPAVRRLAASALRRLGSGVSEGAVSRLTDAVCSDHADSNNSRAQRHAAQALASIGDLEGPALDQLARALQDARPDVRRNAALALRNVGGGGAVLVESLAAALHDLTNKARTRRNAAQSLGKLGAVAISATSALAVAAADKSGDVRRRAIEALGLVGAAAADAYRCTGASAVSAAEGSSDGFLTGILSDALLRDSDVIVREAAALALMRVDVAIQTLGGGTASSPERAAETLSTALSRDQSAVVRKISAWALGAIWPKAQSDNHAVTAGFESRLLLLAETLSSDLSPDVRRNAADALGRIGGDVAAAHLMRALDGDANACVRRHAAKALGLSPALAALDATAARGDGNKPVLSVSGFAASLRTDSGAMTRKLAADALGELLMDGASLAEMQLGIGALTAALSDDTHSKVRKHCAWALAKAWPACSANGVASTSLAPAMHQLSVVLVEDSNQRVRSHAAETLGRLGADAAPAVAALAVALRDESRRVRVRVATALGMVGFAAHPAAKELAATCLDDRDPGVRGNAVQSLALVVADAPVDGDRDRSAAAAVAMLADALGTASLPAEETALGTADATAHSRERAAVALRMLGSAARPAGAALATALGGDENAIVRKHCAWALGSIWARGDGDSGILLLAHTLKSDRDPDVRRNATNALGARTAVFCAAIFFWKPDHLPRQARDKHEGNSKLPRRFLSQGGLEAMLWWVG